MHAYVLLSVISLVELWYNELDNLFEQYWNGYLEASALAWAWFNCRNWKHGQDDKVVKSAKFVKQLGKFGSFIGQNIQHNTGDVIGRLLQFSFIC